jgi:hypothetical protein
MKLQEFVIGVVKLSVKELKKLLIIKKFGNKNKLYIIIDKRKLW